MAKPTTNYASITQQKPTSFKPLSVEQENALDYLIARATDAEVAAAVGVNRSTVWEWRTSHPLFQATLQRRRAEVWRAPQEKLRSLMAKAVENLAGAVESSDLRASIELFKYVVMYGNGTMNAIREQDPWRILADQAKAQVQREGISDNAHLDSMIASAQNPCYTQRLAQITMELEERYLER
jgi:hypothetical protein